MKRIEHKNNSQCVRYPVPLSLPLSLHALGLKEMMGVYYSINTTMIMTGLLMLILSGIFRYGAYLQEEYDATL